MKLDTRIVRAGISPDPTTGAILPPIYETATFVLEEVGKDKGFDYTRSLGQLVGLHSRPE